MSIIFSTDVAKFELMLSFKVSSFMCVIWCCCLRRTALAGGLILHLTAIIICSNLYLHTAFRSLDFKLVRVGHAWNKLIFDLVWLVLLHLKLNMCSCRRKVGRRHNAANGLHGCTIYSERTANFVNNKARAPKKARGVPPALKPRPTCR